MWECNVKISIFYVTFSFIQFFNVPFSDCLVFFLQLGFIILRIVVLFLNFSNNNTCSSLIYLKDYLPFY